MATTRGKGRTTTDKTEKVKVACSCCGKERDLKVGFYVSYSMVNKNNKRLSICKECVWEFYDKFFAENEDEQTSVYRVCRLLDFPYLEKPFLSSIDEVETKGGHVLKTYLKNINSLKQYAEYTFENGDSIDNRAIEEKEIKEIEDNLSDRDKQNEKDVIRILGYDPFESENKKDRKFLFNRLVDMLDDSTLEDNVKLMSVISIVKGFNQMEYIDQAIANLTSDISKLNTNNGGIKSLVDTKKNLMTTVMKMAEDNGISTKFNTNKSKGSGTLSGTMKKLGEIGLSEAEVNLFDIQTANGMSQVADMSHNSIVKQLLFDENDYTEMLAYQRGELMKLGTSRDKLDEENRRLKIKLKELENKLKDNNNFV